jgi:predicted metalloprotease with PDZ domain
MKLSVIRERKPMSFTVKMGEMPSDEPIVAEGPATDEWGLSVEPLTGDAALRLDLPVNRGLLVTDVQPGSPAERAGLRRGDVILEIARRPADDAANLHKALNALKPGESVLIYVHRTGGSGTGANQYLVMERSKKP